MGKQTKILYPLKGKAHNKLLSELLNRILLEGELF